MKKTILFIALLSLVLTLVLVIPASARSYSPMQLIYERLSSCGYECNFYDNCLGPDETLEWGAQGDLRPGESYTYTWQPSCGPREIIAYAGTSRGYNTDLLVVITATVQGQELRAEGIGRACIYWNWSNEVNTPWQVTVTNVDSRLARATYFSGRNQMQIGESCI